MARMARILTGDNVAFPAGPGLLTLPNSAVVTCPGKYTVPVKGKYRFMPYTGDAVSFTVSARSADNAKVSTHELGTKPEPKTAAADEEQTDGSASDDSATAEDEKGAGE
jgi:hypothetical protein